MRAYGSLGPDFRNSVATASFSGRAAVCSTSAIHFTRRSRASSRSSSEFRIFAVVPPSASTCTFLGFFAPPYRFQASSTAIMPSEWYCSIWSAETKSPEPTVSNPPACTSAGNSRTSISTPSRSRSVLAYSRRLSRRIVTAPPESARDFLAETITCARSSSRSALAADSICFASSGGISPEFKTFSTLCHRSAASIESTAAGSVSTRKPPFVSSGPWHLRQCAARRGGVAGFTAGGAGRSAATQWPANTAAIVKADRCFRSPFIGERQSAKPCGLTHVQ